MNYAKTLIYNSKMRALIEDMKRRQEIAVKNLDFYDFEQFEYTEAEAKEKYPNTFREISRYIATVPLTRSMVHRLSKRFQKDPAITPITESQNIIDEVIKAFDSARLFGTLKTIDRMAELTGMIGVMPVWNPIKQRVFLDILSAMNTVVFTHDRYTDTPETVLIRIDSQDSGINPRRVDLWAIWTADTYAEAYLKTDYTVDEYIVPPEPHKYGRIPIAWFTPRPPIKGFWAPDKSPIVVQNLRTNIQLSNLDLALDYQAYATMWTKGWPEGKDLIVGLSRHISLPSDDNAGAGAGYINPSTDLRQIWEIINSNIEMTAALLGISVDATKSGSQFSSGYQLKLSMQGVQDYNNDKNAIYRESLRDLAQLICACTDIYSTKVKLPHDLEFSVEFADIPIDENPLEVEQINSMRLTQKTTDRAEILIQRNPDMTRDEAEERIAQIDAAQPTFSRPESGLDSSLFSEQ